MKKFLFCMALIVLIVFVFACGGTSETSNGIVSQTKNTAWGSLTWGTNKWEKKNE